MKTERFCDSIMPYIMGGFVILAFVICIFATFVSPYVFSHFLRNEGFLAEHKLVRIDHFKSLDGNLSGSFFFGSGSINEGLATEYKLQFWWLKNDNEIISTSLPYGKFFYIIDDSREVPSVEFVFYDRCQGGPYGFVGQVHPNQLLQSKSLASVKLYISTSTIEKEIFLPKQSPL